MGQSDTGSTQDVIQAAEPTSHRPVRSHIPVRPGETVFLSSLRALLCRESIPGSGFTELCEARVFCSGQQRTLGGQVPPVEDRVSKTSEWQRG